MLAARGLDLEFWMNRALNVHNYSLCLDSTKNNPLSTDTVIRRSSRNMCSWTVPGMSAIGQFLQFPSSFQIMSLFSGKSYTDYKMRRASRDSRNHQPNIPGLDGFSQATGVWALPPMALLEKTNFECRVS